MTRTSELLESNLVMTQRELNGPNYAVKINREITKKLPPEFSYLLGFLKLNKRQGSDVEAKHSHKLRGITFSYKTAKAQDDKYCEEENCRVKTNLNLREVTNKKTGVKFQYELDQGRRSLQSKKTMECFRELILEENNKKYAWGRSLASAYPVKLNQTRWLDTNGDWQRQPAS